MVNTLRLINADEIVRGQNFIYSGRNYKATEVRVMKESVTIDVEGSGFGIKFAREDKLELLP